VEHIKSGTARDFLEVNSICKEGAVSERNDRLETHAQLPVRIAREVRKEITSRTDCAKRSNGISGTIKTKEKNEDCACNRANAIPVHNPI
jgi:hypothetical protein